MATIYAPPENCQPPAPDFRNYDVEKTMAREQDFIDKLAKIARNHGKGDLVGEVVRFGVADGYAQYMIWNHRPLELVHLPIGDAWQIPEAHARGLRISELRKQIENAKALAARFAARQTHGDAQNGAETE